MATTPRARALNRMLRRGFGREDIAGHLQSMSTSAALKRTAWTPKAKLVKPLISQVRIYGYPLIRQSLGRRPALTVHPRSRRTPNQCQNIARPASCTSTGNTRAKIQRTYATVDKQVDTNKINKKSRVKDHE